ncbi:tetratricopeptide repeat protein [Methylophilaceae bacterium]|nr:tetratricopeptide repeat protein [Methylophilaceae bacterium]
MKNLTLSEKRKQIAEAKKIKKAKSPPQELLIKLLELYQTGQNDDAEKLAVYLTQEFPYHQFGWKVLGAILAKTKRKSEAVNANRRAMELAPQDAEAHSNLGAILQELGRFYEAEACFTQAIVLKPDYIEAHNNLGLCLQELGGLEEAEASHRRAIALKPDFVEAYNNLGNTLKKLGRLDEAEASYAQAIDLNPNYPEAYSNLGIALEELGRLEEAEVSTRKSIKLKPDFSLAYYNLSRILYKLGYKDLALESAQNAHDISPELKEYELILTVIKSRISREESKAVGTKANGTDALKELPSSPLILNREVEEGLINRLYEMSFLEIEKLKRGGLLASGRSDARYGNGKCSPDFNLFQDSSSTIQKLAEDLTRILMEAVKSDVFILDSFFNILGAGGGLTPHKHIMDFDKDIGFNLGKQKYSLVYYLSVGDQDCKEPGILKLYEPDEDILPNNGMIIIFPSSRLHSAVYGGKTDRVMIGVNFYSL